MAKVLRGQKTNSQSGFDPSAPRNSVNRDSAIRLSAYMELESIRVWVLSDGVGTDSAFMVCGRCVFRYVGSFKWIERLVLACQCYPCWVGGRGLSFAQVN
jgi:hypothetical protein